MPVTRNKPDPLVRKYTRDDKHVTDICLGSPLQRLQLVHDDPDGNVLAGDVLDVCNASDASDPVVARVAKLVVGKRKGELVVVSPDDVAHITERLTQAV